MVSSAESETDGIIFIVICCLLLLEIIYFLSALLWYNSNNPQYLSFWAVCVKKSNTSKIEASKSNSCTTATTRNDSKMDNFIAYGIDTILHCILFPLYLAGLMVNISLKIYIENINILVLKQQDSWLNHKSFCKYGYVARIIFPTLSQYLLYIVICSRSLRMEWFRPQATKCHRFFPLIVILWMILFFLLDLIDYIYFLYEPNDNGTDCVLQTSSSTGWTFFISLFTIINFSLCFIVFWRPFCIQKAILKNLLLQDDDFSTSTKSSRSTNKDIFDLIKKINQITKRVCLLGTFGIVIAWIALALYVIFGSSWVFYVIYLLIMIHEYIILCCTFNDAKIKLFSFWYYSALNDASKDEKKLAHAMQTDKSTSHQTPNVECQIH